MLLINFLPWRKAQMRQRARRWLRLLWLQMGLMFCFIAVAYLLWQHRQQRAHNEFDVAQVQQQQLASRYQQTHQARETLRRYQVQERAEAIVRYDNRRNLHLLDRLAGMMPARLWLTEIADRGSHLLLSGVSENYHDIIMLQNALLRHVSVERVQLLQTSRERGVNSWLRFSFQADWHGAATAPSLGEDHD